MNFLIFYVSLAKSAFSSARSSSTRSLNLSSPQHALGLRSLQPKLHLFLCVTSPLLDFIAVIQVRLVRNGEDWFSRRSASSTIKKRRC